MQAVKKTVIATGFTAAFSAALCATAYAQAPAPARSPEALERVYACAKLTGDAERLACFDAAVGRLQQAQTQGEITAIDKAQARAIERESFGFTLPSLNWPNLFGGASPTVAEAPTEAVTSTITRVTGSGRGATFILENGQAWQSVDSDANRNARPGAPVSVRRAAFGSFLMSVETGGTALRVRRVQ